MSASADAQRQAEGIDGHRWRLHEASGVRLPCRILCECGWTSTAAQRSSVLLQLKGHLEDSLRSGAHLTRANFGEEVDHHGQPV